MPINPTDVLGTGEINIPASVGAVTPDQKDLYRAAMEFERFFVSHLMKQMDAATKALKDTGSDDAEGDASTGAYNDMINDQMTQSVLDGGGLGLASMLYTQLNGQLPQSAGQATPAPGAADTPAVPRAATTTGGSL